MWNKNTKQAQYGGAIYLKTVLTVVIYDDVFSKSNITKSGSGVYMEDCLTISSTSKVIESSRFLNCQATADSYAGGGICLYLNNQYNNFVTNSLFSGCSGWFGGGVYLNYPSTTYKTSLEQYPILFCFFNHNSFLRTGGGNDVALRSNGNYVPSDTISLLLSCFSTTTSNRIGYYNGAYASNNFYWLPQGMVTCAQQRYPLDI